VTFTCLASGHVWVWEEQTLLGFCSKIGKSKAADVSCEGTAFQVLTDTGLLYRHPGILDPNKFYALPGNEPIISIASGSFHSLFVTESGTVYSYGHGGDGKLGLGDTADHIQDIQQITAFNDVKIATVACGLFHSLAVSDTGRLYSWGHGKYGQLGHRTQKAELTPKLVEDITLRVVGVAASKFYTSVLAGTKWRDVR
jgi:hypothetical protein